MTILDTSILVLVCVGLADRSFVQRHKNLKAYEPEDFDLLKSYIAQLEKVAVTPNIAAEASNLLFQVSDPIRTQIMAKFREILTQWLEYYEPSRNAVARGEFTWMGVADCATLSVLDGEKQLLTADAKLHIAAANAGLKSVNFNHLREARFG
ncbi:MAG: hypothetical protein AAF940_07145 [Pseudomonadota bacterium]